MNPTPSPHAELIGRLAAHLRARLADDLLPSLLTIVLPYLRSDGGRTADATVSVAMLQQLGGILRHHPGLVIPVVSEVGPHLQERGVKTPDRTAGGVVLDRRLVTAMTEREVEVLCGMAEGLSNGDIGKRLFLAEDTVKTHARRMFRKLAVHDRAHAVARGYQLGILVVPGHPLRAVS